MKKFFKWKTAFNISMILFSVSILIYFCVSENGLIDLVKSAREFNKFWLMMAVFFHLFNIFIDAYLLFKFVNTSNVRTYRFKSAFKSCMVGQFFSAITPGASGGQPMQVYSMSGQGIDPGHATSALMQKFLVYQSTITIYSALTIFLKSYIFRGDAEHLMRGLSIFGFCSQAFVILAILLFSFNRVLTSNIITYIITFLGKIRVVKNPEEKIKNIETQLYYFHLNNSRLYKTPSLVILAYVYTVIQITSMFVVPYCIYRAFNLHGASVSDMIGAQAFVFMVSSFMPIPGGSGAAEGGFLVFFNSYFTEETLKPATLLWRIITYFFTILISLPFSKINKPEEDAKIGRKAYFPEG